MSAPVQRIPIVQGDYGVPFSFTLLDRFKAKQGRTLDALNPDTWAPHNLSRVTAIRIPIVRPDGSTASALAMRQQPYAEGRVIFGWVEGLFADPGIYEAEMQLEYNGGTTETIYQKFQFVVRENQS